MKTIPLSNGMNAIVDDIDFPALAALKWCIHSQGYARRRGTSGANGKQSILLMHRVIINAPRGFQVDHINGNRLDNRRSNLRLATNAENGANQMLSSKNTTGAKGVYFHRQRKKYCAMICSNGRREHLGLFSNIEAASAAYDAAARRLFGEFAKTNATLNQAEAV